MLNVIFNEDNKETIKRMDDDFLDLVITSPPYNVDLGNSIHNKKSYDIYKDNLPLNIYMNNMKEMFELLYSKLKSGGRAIINIGSSKNGRIPTNVYFTQMMINIGYIPMTTIIWDKGTTNPRTAWGSFKSPSCPSFPTPFEYVLVFAKESCKLQNKGITDLTKEEFVSWSLAKWSFPGQNSKKVDHPAPFPIELPLRCIKMFSWVNSIVYDPFMGSGTTAVACLKTRRFFIGSEISERYYQNSLKRIKETYV